MISVRTRTGWIIGAAAAMVVLGMGALLSAGELDDRLLVTKHGAVLVPSTSVPIVVISPRTSRDQSAGPVEHKISAQTGGVLHEVDSPVKPSRKSVRSHAQEASLTFEELRELEQRLDHASLSYWNTQINPTH